MWSQLGRGPGCALDAGPGRLCLETPLHQVPYNAVLRFRPPGDLGSSIDALVARAEARGVELIWWLHPTAAPSLAACLRARGLVEAEVVEGMAADVAAVPEPGPAPAGARVCEVGLGERDAYVDLLAWRYGLGPEARPTLHGLLAATGIGVPGSPTRAWLAVAGGRAVAKACLHHDAGVAGIYGVATHADARRTGLGRHLTTVAVAAARAAGAEVVVLHSSPMAVGLYRSLGFRSVAPFPLYARPGRLHL
jgi:ribosomal protein S18 acetylase RimI-like enzyme